MSNGLNPLSFRIATWNVLATVYIRPEFYPNTPPQVLNPEWRVPALVNYAANLDADILCLQEVERPVFAALEAGLSGLGYTGLLSLKDGGKPDGCATFLRTNCCDLLSEQRVVYADGLNGSLNSGHIAQLILLNVCGMRVALVNTHLKWDPPNTPAESQVGTRQAKLAAHLLRNELQAIQIVCGDFNSTQDSYLVGCLTEAGFDYTFRDDANVFTCNSNGRPKLIDYVFCRGAARVEPEALLPVTEHTPLPSFEQPSDHLPVVALVLV